MVGDGSAPNPGFTTVASKQQLHGLRPRTGCHTKDWVSHQGLGATPRTGCQADTISLLWRGLHSLLSQGDATLRHSHHQPTHYVLQHLHKNCAPNFYGHSKSSKERQGDAEVVTATLPSSQQRQSKQLLKCIRINILISYLYYTET